MKSSFTQTARTLTDSITIRGVGIHTGAESTVTLFPAEPGAGITFLRDNIEIKAHAGNVIDTSRCTILGTDGASVSTVEHLLSALSALGVTDVRIEIQGPELPIGDGGAQIWVAGIHDVGLTEIGNRTFPLLDTPLIVTGKDGAFIAAYPATSFRLTVAISFGHPLVGTQLARFEPDINDYSRDIAPARTFGFIEEVEALRAAGLALGGTLENAVVIYPDRYSVPLRFENELARHKLLDVIGDLSLAGVGALPPADIIAVKPSHRLNAAFAAKLHERLFSSPAWATE